MSEQKDEAPSSISFYQRIAVLYMKMSRQAPSKEAQMLHIKQDIQWNEKAQHTNISAQPDKAE